MTVKRAVIYARLSLSTDESVSIERQVESCTKFAEAQDWEVVTVLVDDGVSATHNKPEARVGWRNVLTLHEPYDVVLVWKIDRLARRVLDFLHADEALRERGAAVVSATEPIDMSTGQGQAFATMLAVFAQLEADAISTRVKGARDYLLRHGRAVGGTVPYGYRSIENPDGKGFVLAQDEAAIDYVIKAADRALSGDTVYGVTKWLSEHAPLPVASQKTRKHTAWSYSTVERILRNPILAGMTAYNPGNTSKLRGADVLRDESGMPVVDESLAILSTGEWRKLVGLLDADGKPQRRTRASQVTAPLLAGLATCGECRVTMHRGTASSRPALYCPKCFQTISMTQLVPHLGKRLLDERGDEYGIEEVEEPVDNAAELADIQEAMNEVTAKMTRDEADVSALLAQLEGLKALRSKARETPAPRYVLNVHKTNVRQEWQAATSDEQRRDVLMWQLKSLSIHRGKVGRYLDPSRVRITWNPAGEYEEAINEAFSQMEPGDLFTEG